MVGAMSGVPLRLYAHALAPSVPLVRSLPAVRRSGGGLPAVEVHRVGVHTDVGHLAAYARLTGHAVGDRLPGLYPHLAAFGPQLEVVTDRGFPFAALGLVHVHNTVVQHRPLLVGETYDLRVRPRRLRPHRSGRLVNLESTVTVEGETVWTATSTVLARDAGDRSVVDDSPLAGVEAPAGATGWRVPAGTGRAFARLSGDVNPIHLSRPTARLFGFPRPIAHGMWTAARALAAVEPALPDAYRYEVAFRRPLLLPADVRFGTVSGPGEMLLGVTSADGDSTHLVGRVRPL